MFPLLLVTMTILWQAALYGYTYSLAGNAADEAARAATAAYAVDGDVAAACEAAWRPRTSRAPGTAPPSTAPPRAPSCAPRSRPTSPSSSRASTAGWTVNGEAGAALEGDPQ